MNSVQHLQPEQLLRLADGELGPAEAARVRLHLEACWDCRAELDAVEKTIAACVRYRKEVLEAHLPPPPKPWADLGPEMARLDERLAGISFVQRMAFLLQGARRNWIRWAPAGVAVVLVAVLVYQHQTAPTVQAARLLQKAVAASSSSRPGLKNIEIRYGSRVMTRFTGKGAAARTSIAGRQTLASVENLFRQANYSWDDPLSAQAYLAWHEGLEEKNSQIVNRGTESIEIHTNTQAGILTDARLTLRSSDFRPVEARFEFRGAEIIELTEIPVETTTEAVPVRPSPSAEAPARGQRQESVTTPPVVGPSDELRVLAVIHTLGADLGDPVEVSRSKDKVLVTAAGLDPGRRQEIETALAGEPAVELRISSASVPANPGTAVAVRTPPASSALSSRIEKQLGSAVAFERFAAQALDHADQLMARAHALRRLAERFPASVERSLSEPDRRRLDQLRQAHAVVLARHAIDLHQQLGPVLEAMGAKAEAVGGPPLPESWQSASESIWRSGREAERLLGALLGVTGLGNASGGFIEDRIPDLLQNQVARLRADAVAYGQLALR